MQIASAGGNYSATVRAGTAATSWTATSSESWLTVSPTTGAGSQETTPITITATENNGSATRTATVTFNQGGTSTTTLLVTQIDAYTESCFTMHEDRFESPVLYTAGTGFICGTNSYGDLAKAELFEPAAGNYDVTSINFMYAVNGEEGSVTFKVWANDNGVPGGELVSKTVTLAELYQAGTVSNSKSRGVYTWTLNPSVVVSGNFFAGIDVSNATSGFGLYSTYSDDSYTDSNYELSGGTWTSISSSWTGVNISMYVLPTICPTSAPYVLLSASPSSLSYRATGGSEEITIASNIDWTATSSADWLTITPTSGSGDGTITAVASTNTSDGERTATITVSGEGATPKTINVTQADPNECFVVHEERFTSSPSIMTTGSGNGYVCGSNNYGDIAKAELFELASNYYNVTSIDFKYAVDGEEGSITFKVWANNNGIPGDELATKTVTLSDLYSAGTGSGTTKYGLYTWTLTTPVAVSGNFFAGIDVSEATSYIGLFSTSGYTNSNYEIYNGSWISMTTSWSGLDISMYVLPTVCPIPSYNITVLANNDSYGTVSGGGTFPEGTQVTVSATPTTGYNFINWTENSSVVSTNATYSFTASASRTLVANFQINTYNISATANPSIAGTILGAGEYNYGQTVTLSATANTGYHFVNWTENGSSVSTDAEYSFTVTANRTLVANFQINSYTISASANPTESGTVNGTGEYDYGQSATLTAVPNTGYTFANWTENGSVVSSNAQYTFTVSGSRTLVANFNPIVYTIAASASPAEGGSISGAGDYSFGQTVTLSATANTGYSFTNWTEGSNVVSTDANYSFTVSGNRTLVANFTINTYTVTAIANPTEGGTVAIDVASQNGVYSYGTNLVITATANDGYHFTQWSDGVTEAQRSYTVVADVEFVAYFTEDGVNEYSIAAIANPAEGGSVSGAGIYEENTQVVLTATANIGYTFTNWTENGEIVSTNAEYSFTATADRTLVANFTINTYTIIASASEGGSILPDGVVVVNAGAFAIFTILANEGYRLVSVIVDADTENEEDVTEQITGQLIEPVYTFTNVNANHTIHATFEAIPVTTYTITVSIQGNGTVTYEGNELENYETVTVAEGATPEFTIIPAEGYMIAGITIGEAEEGADVVFDGEVDDENVYTFDAVTANMIMTVTFVRMQYAITVNVGEHGTVTYNGEEVTSIMVAEGSTPAFVITPEENYQIDVLSVDGIEEELTEEQLSGFSYIFEPVMSDLVLSVTFTCLNAADMIEAASIAIYPNPNNGIFTLSMESIEGDVTCQIVNASGSVIETREINATDGSEFVFDCNVAPGVYFVRVISGDRVWTESVVIDR